MRSLIFLLFAASIPLFPGETVAQEQGETTRSQPIALEVDDASIKSRLESLFAAIDDLSGIEVGVQSGVVTLSGSVSDSESGAKAVKLAENVEGVVMVFDDLKSDTDVSTHLLPVVDKFQELGEAFLRRVPLVLLAVLTLLAFLWLGNLVYRRESWFTRLHLSSLASDLARRVVRLAVFAVGLVIALEILDATAIVGAVMGAAGLVGLAIGFAFKSIIENYLAGVLLSTRNPFEIGDEIEINGHRGKVARLTARDTVLVTLDGNHLRIPNGVVISSELLNFTRNPVRRFEFEAGVSVDLDLNEARKVGLKAMRSNPGVLDEPPPIVLVDTLGDSTVVLKFRAWMDQTVHDFWKTRSETIRLVKTAYDEAGIEMPEPIYRVYMREAPDGPGAPDDSIDVSVPVPGSATVEEDLSADRTIDNQIEEDAVRCGEKNLLPSATD